MKLTLNLFLFLLVFIPFGDKSFSLTNYQIKRKLYTTQIIIVMLSNGLKNF